MKAINLSTLPAIDNSHFQNEGPSELSVTLDQHQHALWFFMDGKPRPSFTPKLLAELKHVFTNLITDNLNDEPIEYVVAASAVPGVYNLGGT